MIDNIQLIINACTGGIEDHNNAVPRVEINPNPFHDQAALQLVNVNEGSYKLSVYDRLGSNILETTITPSHGIILAKNFLRPGLYLYQVMDGSHQIATGKFMIE